MKCQVNSPGVKNGSNVGATPTLVCLVRPTRHTLATHSLAGIVGLFQPTHHVLGAHQLALWLSQEPVSEGRGVQARSASAEVSGIPDLLLAALDLHGDVSLQDVQTWGHPRTSRQPRGEETACPPWGPSPVALAGPPPGPGARVHRLHLRRLRQQLLLLPRVPDSRSCWMKGMYFSLMSPTEENPPEENPDLVGLLHALVPAPPGWCPALPSGPGQPPHLCPLRTAPSTSHGTALASRDLLRGQVTLLGQGPVELLFLPNGLLHLRVAEREALRLRFLQGSLCLDLDLLVLPHLHRLGVRLHGENLLPDVHPQIQRDPRPPSCDPRPAAGPTPACPPGSAGGR